MKKGKKIGITIGVIATVLILAVTILGFTGILKKVFFEFQEPQLCDEAHTNEECYCLEGYEKMTYKGYNTFYYCENTVKTIDVDSANFETEFEIYAEAKLKEIYPDCDMTSCNSGQAKWVIDSGVFVGEAGKETPKRIVKAQCYDETQAITFAEINVDIEKGELLGVYPSMCIDYFQKEQFPNTSIVTGVIQYIPTDPLQFKWLYDVECNAIGDTPIGDITYTMPKGLILGCGSENSNCRVEGDKLIMKITEPVCTAIREYGSYGGYNNNGNRMFRVVSNNLYCLVGNTQYYNDEYRCTTDYSGLKWLGLGRTDNLEQCQNGQWETTNTNLLECSILSDGQPYYEILNTDGNCEAVITTAHRKLLDGQEFCNRYGKWVCNDPTIPLYACTEQSFVYLYSHGICEDGEIKTLGSDLQTCSI